MAKPKSINPCRMKGRYLGHRSAGRTYKPKSLAAFTLPGCECANAFLNFCSTQKSYLEPKLNFVADKASLRGTDDYVKISVKKGLPPDKLIAVPCTKIFLHPDSEGTKLHKRLKAKQNVESKFKGCYSVDEALLNERAINYDLREGTEKYFDLLDSLEIHNYQDEIRDLYFAQLLPKFSKSNSSGAVGQVGVLSALIDKFDQQRSINQNDLLIEASFDPEISESDEYPKERVKKIEKAFSKMTRLQRLAVKAVYFKNYENKPRAEIAVSLGISVDTLRDRLDLAFKKVKAEFREYFREKLKVEPVEVRGKPLERFPKIPQPIRRTSADGSIVVITPTESNQHPFGEYKTRTDIDVEAVKRKIRRAS